MLGLLWVAAPVLAAQPFAGLEIDPLSRQDLVFVDEGRTSGTGVGELDGTVRSVASAYAGAWITRHVGIAAGLGVAIAQASSRAGDVERQKTIGVFRPSLDVRLGWMERRPRFPIPWFLVGFYGDIPTASDRSTGFTEEEQTAADEASFAELTRLGGFGARVGAAVDYEVLPGLGIGAQVTVGLQRSAYLGADETLTSLWISTEASILLQFTWPDRRKAGEAARQDPGEVEEESASEGD